MTRQMVRAPEQKGIIYVEVMLNDSASNSFRVADIKTGVANDLRYSHTEVRVGQAIPLRPLLASAIARAEVSGYSRSKEFPDDSFYTLADSDLDIAVYTLYSHDDHESELDRDDETDNESPSHQFNVTRLPHTDFEGLWESLIYDEPIKDLTLRIVMRGIQERFNAPQSHYTAFWQNTILFHGPPGSGKTTLAHALAQKLSIRLSNIFSHTTLVKVKSSGLLSRYFGESSKKIGEFFNSISSMAVAESQLIVVFFDEVESVAACRQKASRTNEVADAIRSTNEILQGLDDFRSRPNVIFMFTSNLFANLDSAFVSRCFIKEFINTPTGNCAFEILRSEVNSLIQANKVYFNELVYHESQSNELLASDEPDHVPRTATSNYDTHIASPASPCHVPDLRWANTHWPQDAITAVSELHRIAVLARGITGRNLRGLLTLARYRHTIDDPCELRDLLLALELVLRKDIVKVQETPESAALGDADEEMEDESTAGIGDFLAHLEENGSRGSRNG